MQAAAPAEDEKVPPGHTVMAVPTAAYEPGGAGVQFVEPVVGVIHPAGHKLQMP